MKYFLSTGLLLSLFLSSCTFWGGEEIPESPSTPPTPSYILPLPSEYGNSPTMLSCREVYEQKCGKDDACKAKEEKQCASLLIATEAMRKGEIGLCDAIPQDSEKMICKDAIFTKTALQEQSFEGCEKVTAVTAKSICIMEVAISQAKTKKSPAVCDRLEGRQKDKCIQESIFGIVLETKDDTWCAFLTEELLKNSCLAQAKRGGESQ